MSYLVNNRQWGTNIQCAGDQFVWDYSSAPAGYKMQDQHLAKGDLTCFTGGRYHARLWTLANGRVVAGIHHEFTNGWCLCHDVDGWESAEDQFRSDVSGGYANARQDAYWMNNAGTFDDVYNDGYASTIATTVKIESWRTTDTYSRSHGLSIDQALPVPWWPPYQSGYQFLVTSSPFTYNKEVFLPHGEQHFVEEAASGFVPSYAWHTKITITSANGVTLAEADVGRDTHIRVYWTN